MRGREYPYGGSNAVLVRYFESLDDGAEPRAYRYSNNEGCALEKLDSSRVYNYTQAHQYVVLNLESTALNSRTTWSIAKSRGRL